MPPESDTAGEVNSLSEPPRSRQQSCELTGWFHCYVCNLLRSLTFGIALNVGVRDMISLIILRFG